MYKTNAIVKLLSFLLVITFIAACSQAAETGPVKPHMMYFYNPSCRLCTATNEEVAKAEEKHDKSLTHQRFNIADSKSGTDNVMYMFELLDEMQVPPEDNVTLVVFLGLLEEEDGQTFFAPKRVMVEGENIIGKLDAEIVDFLQKEGKGGKPLGLNRPAGFFFAHSPSLALAR